MTHCYPTLELEHRLLNEGYRYVVGVDEAGRGPWAGPLTAGAVVVDLHTRFPNYVRDSKFMTAKERERAYTHLQQTVCGWAVSTISHETLDTVGISEAVRSAMEDAVQQSLSTLTDATYDNTFVIVDGSKTLSLRACNTKKYLRGGALHASISAASILAKVHRDRLMVQMHREYPQYRFDIHKGYGTKQHQLALAEFGICPIHRRSFAPLQRLISNAVPKTHIPQSAVVQVVRQ